MKELAKFASKVEYFRTNRFSHDQRPVQYSKLPLTKQESEVHFPLHNRNQLVGEDYSSKFEALSSMKASLGRLETQRVKVSIQLDQPEKKEAEETGGILKDIEYFSQLMKRLLDFKQMAAKVQEYNTQSDLVPIESWKDEGAVPPIPRTRQPKNFERITNKNQLRVYFSSPVSSDLHQKELQRLKKINKITYLQIKVVLELTDWQLRFESKLLRKAFRRVVLGRAKLYPSLAQGFRSEKSLSTEQSFVGDVARSPARQSVAGSLDDLLADLLAHYSIDNNKASAAIFQSFFTSGSLIETIFTLFPNRSASDFLKYEASFCAKPIAGAMQLTLFSNLAQYPVAHMRNYFGDKVALYFAFMNFWRDWLLAPAAAGIVYFAIEMVYRSDNRHDDEADFVEKLYEVASYAFLIFMAVWKNLFLVGWIRYEKVFSASTGDEQDEEDASVRTGFSGRHARSLTNDKINGRFGDPKATLIKGTVLALIGLVSVVLTFVSVNYIILAKRYAFNQIDWDYDLIIEDLSVKMILFDFIEFLRIKFYRAIYFAVVKRMIVWMDLKLIKTHEEMLILTLATYQVINNSAFILLIYNDQAWADSVRDEKGVVHIKSDQCIKSNCGEEAVFFFLSYIILHLLFTLTHHMFSAVASSLRKKAKKFSGSSRKLEMREEIMQSTPDYHQYISRSEDTRSEVLKNLPANSEDGQKIADRAIAECHLLHQQAYTALDEEIEAQVTQLASFSSSQNYDEMLFDYLEIFNTYSYLVLFGGLFSQSFFIAWVIGILESYLNRNKLMHSKRRPVPSYATSIGLWIKMFRIVTFFGVLTNGFYLTIVLLEDKDTSVRLACFAATVIGFGVVDFYAFRFVAGETNRQKAIRCRREFIRSQLFSYNKQNKVPHMHGITTSETLFSGQLSKAERTGIDMFAVFSEEEEESERRAQVNIEFGIMSNIYRVNRRKFQSLLTPSEPNKPQTSSRQPMGVAEEGPLGDL